MHQNGRMVPGRQGLQARVPVSIYILHNRTACLIPINNMYCLLEFVGCLIEQGAVVGAGAPSCKRHSDRQIAGAGAPSCKRA